ncbi:SAM-dependent methyltransferase [Falsirhodobacter xinxiangensis]|uniref:SAM-dependent methyltransferase n=1 Tax=Falsirhodobacter xinxiangensis TaxID=2530049 RepID=UPI00145BAA71|nr:SAM-dependent methyltransferase [Rhodobacter xinxiangensis]
MPHSRTFEHLSRLYAASDDPWGHRTSRYEAAKFDATIAALGPDRFHDALEIGCGNGTLAARLAPHCDKLTLVECIPAAVASARAAVPQATVLQGTAPADLPDMRPDLVLLSEVLYFMTEDGVVTLGQWLRRNAQGPVIAVNWTGPTDEDLDGDAAIRVLSTVLGAPRTVTHDCFRIDRFD